MVEEFEAFAFNRVLRSKEDPTMTLILAGSILETAAWVNVPGMGKVTIKERSEHNCPFCGGNCKSAKLNTPPPTMSVTECAHRGDFAFWTEKA